MDNGKKIKIKVTYKSDRKIDERADRKIKNIFDHIGATWYAQGIDTNTGERDICFDFDLELK